MTTLSTLGFIGAGNMGSALLKGFTASGAAKNVQIHIYDVNSEKRKELSASGFNICEDELELAKKCKYILLACKPQQLTELLKKIKPNINSNTVLISICAGISVDFIKNYTYENIKVVLIMPNMPAILGEGACAIARDSAVSDEEFAFAKSIAEGCGIAEEIPLGKMNEIICINASSPAFIYLFVKSFADYALQQGIDGKAALNLFSQTLIGSAKMLQKSSEKSIDELISQVTSKGGTTFAGLEALENGGFERIIRGACEACTNRAYELGK